MNYKLLLIDDEATFADQLRRACTSEAVDVVVAPTASQGIDLAWSDLPSAIVLSPELPDINGFVVCSAIKKNPRLREIPLVLASGTTRQETFRRHMTLSTRADQYFHKERPVGELVSALLPLLRDPRDQWLSRIAAIPADKPILKKASRWPLMLVCVLVALLIAVEILVLILGR